MHRNMFNNIKEHLAAEFSVGYVIFQHRKQLERKSSLLERSRSKLNLTEVLLSYSSRCMSQYTGEELLNLKREIMFSKKLESRMEAIKKLESLNGGVQLTLVPKRRLARRTASIN